MASPASADWINLTGAETSPNIVEIYVLDDHVKLVLEIYIGDLDVFEDLVPDDLLKEVAADRPDTETRLRHFAEQNFRFVTESGEKLNAYLQLAEPRVRKDRQSPFAGMINPVTRQRVPAAPADKRVLYVEIIYPYTSKPQALTIIPPLDQGGRARASIGFIVYHKSVPVIDFRYLGAPAHLQLDWEDPWYTKFDNPNLKRHHKSALMSFLYVEPHEVRHEVLTRVRDLENWLDLGLRGNEYIEVDELEPLKKRIGDFFAGRNVVKVDGEAVKPIVDRISYVEVGVKGIQLVENPQRTEISTAIVGVILTYLTDSLPQQVTVDWDLFSDQLQKIPATATDPAGPLPTLLTPDSPLHTWTNYLKNYQEPTVVRLDVRDTLGKISLPLASLIAVLVLIPLFWVLILNMRRGRSVSVQLLMIAVTTVVAIFAYPYARIEVPRHQALAGELDSQQTHQLLQALLQNVYRAFDFREEGDVYDKLALSVSGDLLADIYLQNRKSFAVRKAGGAQARVKTVEIRQASAEKLGAKVYNIRGQWTASGSVGHWGHVHTRTNQYDAIVTVEAVDGYWKVTSLELLEEKRLDPGQPDTAQAGDAT
jgi:hypothetical protein